MSRLLRNRDPLPPDVELAPGLLREVEAVCRQVVPCDAPDRWGVLLGQRRLLWHGSVVRLETLGEAAPLPASDPSYTPGKSDMRPLLAAHGERAVGLYCARSREGGDRPVPERLGVDAVLLLRPGSSQACDAVLALRGDRKVALGVPGGQSKRVVATATAAAVLLAASALWLAPASAPAPRAPARQPAPTPTPVRPPAALGLRAELRGQALAVSWDVQAAAVRSAREGIISVRDGVQHSRFALDGAQLAAGSLTYFPLSADVTFELEVTGGVQDQLRVVGLTPAPARLPSPPAPAPGKAAAPRRVERADGSVAKVAVSGSASRVSQRRPSAFVPPGRKQVELDDDIPEPPVSAGRELKALQPPPFPASEATADLGVAVSAEPVPPSRFTRLVRRIPLVRRLKEPGGYIPPRPLKPVQPAPSAAERKLLTGVTPVAVRVAVGEDGKVESAELSGESPRLPAGIAKAAVASARRWTFEPARQGEEKVRGEMILHFRFFPPGPRRE